MCEVHMYMSQCIRLGDLWRKVARNFKNFHGLFLNIWVLLQQHLCDISVYGFLVKGEYFTASKFYTVIFPVIEASTDIMKDHSVLSTSFSISELEHKHGKTWYHIAVKFGGEKSGEIGKWSLIDQTKTIQISTYN